MTSGFIQVLISGGWMMIPILTCSLLALTIGIERLIYFRKFRSSQWGPKMLECIERNKYTDALLLAEKHSSPVLRVVAEGILKRDQHPTKAMEAAGLAEVTLMKRGLPVLDTIVTLGPLLGLLGTIIGMIDSFWSDVSVGLRKSQCRHRGSGRSTCLHRSRNICGRHHVDSL